MKTVTKRELAELVALQLKQPQVETAKTIEAFLGVLVLTLADGNRVEFRDVGIFEPVIRKAKVAQNPKTLEKVAIPARGGVRFKMGRLLKQGMHKLSDLA